MDCQMKTETVTVRSRGTARSCEHWSQRRRCHTRTSAIRRASTLTPSKESGLPQRALLGQPIAADCLDCLAGNPIVFALRRSSEPWRTRLIVSSRSSQTSSTLFRGLWGKSSTSGRYRSVTLRPCLEPSSAARWGSECRAHSVLPLTAHALHHAPFLFFAEHCLDIVQTPAICRS